MIRRSLLQTSNPTGFSAIELLTLLGVLGLLISVLVPELIKVRDKSRQIDCLNNLKQVGMAFTVQPSEEPELMTRAFQDGGSHLAISDGVAQTFRALSNELDVPGVLICPADSRRPASSWSTLSSSNSSYFVGLDADREFPKMFLSGDAQLSSGRKVSGKVLAIRSSDTLRWASDPHPGGGNICMVDGSVQQVSNEKLGAKVSYVFQNYPAALSNGTLRLALPK